MSRIIALTLVLSLLGIIALVTKQKNGDCMTILFPKLYKKNICVLYSHEYDFEQIKNVIHKIAPNAKIKETRSDLNASLEVQISKGIFSFDEKFTIHFTQREKIWVPSADSRHPLPSDDEEKCPLYMNLNGMVHLISDIPMENDSLKNIFLNKISFTNSQFSFICNSKGSDTLNNVIIALAEKFDAFIFADANTFLNSSNNQKFLDKDLNLITDFFGQSDIDALSVLVNKSKEERFAKEEQVRRKEQSEKILKEQNIKINNFLPCIEAAEEITIRPAKEIAQRIIILTVLRLIAYQDITAQEAIEHLKIYNLWNYVTKKEKEFIENPTEEERCAFSWESEKIYTLMWAINKIDTLKFPSEQCKADHIKVESYSINTLKNPTVFLNAPHKIRNKNEILNMNDLYYRIDWACVDTALSGKELEEGVNSNVVYKRHFALNWLINYMGQEWDDVTCDT